MNYPTPTRPIVNNKDIVAGYIKRYFAQSLITKKITEIDKYQHSLLKTAPSYKLIELSWIIGGVDDDAVSRDGIMIYETKYQNEQIIDFYNEKMPGLNRVLLNPLEFFVGQVKKKE